MLITFKILLILCCNICICSNAFANNSINIVVASNFINPIKKIVQLFENKTGKKVVLSFGSSRSIYTKIKNGAPYDIFLSADSYTPELIEKDGLGIKGTRYTYALGSLVIYSLQTKINKENYIELLKKSNSIAIANPKLAPYGIAAIEFFQNINFYNEVQNKLIYGINASQTHQFIMTNNAEIGIIALSQVIEEKNNYWEIPKTLYSPIIQQLIQLKRSQNNQVAMDFIEFMKSSQVKSIIKLYGYNFGDK